ncbi:MAG: sugar phosphate isomerase/epimerase [Oscillospiraceae bacterium]|jgi:sugar phosphate isomerase/epimerase|nr:sugar phosphate isomerase/epimerase [Oscillospiraceae bacterium]
MQISVSSYSFSKMGASPAERLRLAKELGFAAIEFTEVDLGAARRLREESERLGFPIVCYTVGADFLQAESIGAEAERLCKQVDIAQILGAPMMRHDATRGFQPFRAAHSGFHEALPLLAKGCRQVTEYAAERGVITMVENHGYFCQDSERIAALVGAVSHPNFGALADIGNFLCADEDPAAATGNIAALALHVHAKDFHVKPGCGDDPGRGWFRSRGGNYLRGAIVGHGSVPVRQCLANLRRAGYGGYVSIEFEGMEDCVEALRIGRENLETYINEK